MGGFNPPSQKDVSAYSLRYYRAFTFERDGENRIGLCQVVWHWELMLTAVTNGWLRLKLLGQCDGRCKPPKQETEEGPDPDLGYAPDEER